VRLCLKTEMVIISVGLIVILLSTWLWAGLGHKKYGPGVLELGQGSGWGHEFGISWRVCNMIFVHPWKMK
jgi:hypothetical protein